MIIPFRILKFVNMWLMLVFLAFCRITAEYSIQVPKPPPPTPQGSANFSCCIYAERGSNITGQARAIYIGDRN